MCFHLIRNQSKVLAEEVESVEFERSW